MKQRALRKHIAKQGAKLNKKTCRIMRSGYKPSFVEAEVRGLTTNEDKSKLAKRGYDIYCPACTNHFSSGTHMQRIKCLKCAYSWNVGMYGQPIM